MSTRTRPQTYPRPPAWDRAWLDERRHVADADAFLREALGEEEAADLALIGGTKRNGRQWAPRQRVTHTLPAPLNAEEAAEAIEPTVTATDGQTYYAADLDALRAVPAFEHVTQSATTLHRDRRAYAAWEHVSTYHRSPCDESVTGRPCPRRFKSDGTPSAHQCLAEGRTYVAAIEPHGEDGAARSGAYSKRQGRLAKRTAVGHFPDATYAADPDDLDPIPGSAVVVAPIDQERPHAPTWLESGICTGNGAPTVLERTWSARVVDAGQYVPVAWQRPALVKPEPPAPRKRSGRKVQGVKRSRRGDVSAVARMSEAQRANVEAVLVAILTACDRARAIPERTVAAVDGLTVTYSPADGGTLTLLSPHALSVGSWRGRRAVARTIALEAVAAD